MYSTGRRRSHTFTEGTLDSEPHSNLLSPRIAHRNKNELIRQRSTGGDRRANHSRSPILQRLHLKFLSQGDTERSPTDEDYESRHRSASALEQFRRRENNCEFQIPTLTPPRSPKTPPRPRSLGSTGSMSDLGEFNPDLYKDVSSSDSSIDDEKLERHERVRNKSSLDKQNSLDRLSSSFEKLKYFEDVDRVQTDCVGTTTLSFRYVPKENHLLVKLIDVSLNYQPSPFVKEGQWTIEPLLVIDIVKDGCRSPPSEYKGKFNLVFHKQHVHVMTKEDTCSISLKHNKIIEDSTVKIVMYDGDTVNKDLAVGAVNFDLMQVLSMDGGEKIITKELSMYHEMYNKTEGLITSYLQWNSHQMLLKLDIVSIAYHKEIHHVKEVFVKASVFIGHKEYAEFRSDLYPACQEIDIAQTFRVAITSDKIRNVYILLQVFEKHLMGSISLHRTVIGPYMKPTLKEGTLSCWEKMILSPGEEIKCICNLYH